MMFYCSVTLVSTSRRGDKEKYILMFQGSSRANSSSLSYSETRTQRNIKHIIWSFTNKYQQVRLHFRQSFKSAQQGNKLARLAPSKLDIMCQIGIFPD